MAPETASSAAPAFTPAELAAWCGGAWQHPPAILHGVSNDSRHCGGGALYVALQGERHDGHDFVAAALAVGAAAALVRRDWAAPAGTPLLRVEDPHRALCALAAAFRRATGPFLLGVSGSAGKTSVKELTAALLRPLGETAATRGNWNNAVGLPLSLLAMPRATRRGVFELGMNHPGEIAPLCAVLRPDAAILTSVGPVHLEFFESEAAIADEKAELLRAVPASGFVVLDADSPHFPFLRRQTAARVVTIGIDAPDADFRGSAIDDVNGALTVSERDGGTALRLHSGRPGRHQARNVLLAAAAARQCGVPWSAIADALPRASPPPMRWEVSQRDGVTVVNDAYNANPMAMRCALETFDAQTCAGHRILVLGEMRELGRHSESAHRALGAQVAAGGSAVLVAVGAAGAWIAEGARDGGYHGRILTPATPAEAGKLLNEIAISGDAVLLKASRGVALEAALEAWQRGL